jgi:YVTN family beta-propeller protein
MRGLMAVEMLDGWRTRLAGRPSRMVAHACLVFAMAVPVTTAGGSRAIAAQPRAYIGHPDTGRVSVIDSSTNTVVANFGVGTSPSGVAVSPDNRTAYVANFLDDTVSVVELATVVATLPVGPHPQGIAVSPDGSTVYVANTFGDSLSIIDARIPDVVDTIRVGFGPRGVLVSPDGRRIYVTTFGRQVVVIDGATNAIVSTIPVGRNPWGMALHPTGSPLYVVNNDDHNVSVVSLQGSGPAVTIPVGVGPHTVAITPDGARAYVDNQGAGTLSVIDTATNEVVATFGVGRLPFGLDITPDGTKLFVTLGTLPVGAVAVLDTSTNMVMATIPTDQAASFGRYITSDTPECAFDAAGTRCGPPANECTIPDTCDGSGSCIDQGFMPQGMDCTDDGDPCTRDACNGQGQCVHDRTPRTVCDEASTSGLQLTRDPSDPRRDRLRIKFRGRTPREQRDFGDPTAGTSEVACLYYDSSLVASYTVAGDADRWGDRPRARGWRYANRGASDSSGMSSIGLTAGAAGDARPPKLSLRGKGAELPDPQLPVAATVATVEWQLVNTSTATCFGDRYEAPFAANAIKGGTRAIFRGSR